MTVQTEPARSVTRKLDVQSGCAKCNKTQPNLRRNQLKMRRLPNGPREILGTLY